MAITAPNTDSEKERQLFTELKQHTDIGFQETDRRATGKNRIGSISFDEADELFRSWLDENTWPYDALLFDPRVFTFIFEKTSRLIANKPKGKLNPREGSDMLAAKVNNELLNYQWDQADIGGTMLSKWSLMDINARKYGASFALAKWRYEKDGNKKVLFDGPDMQVLNNRDIAHDLTATAIENCNWFQVRQYVTIQDLKRVNDANRSAPVYKNLDKLEFAVNADGQGMGGGDNRGVNWVSRNRAISGLETDPVGKDDVFKTVEIITEYRRDRWITFAPKHGVILRDIDNPYKNNQLPIIMLRYYSVDDDLYGLSEIEPVKGIQKAINALLCQYVDEINQKLYSPIAVGPGVRQHTLEWGKGARWMMNNPMSDFRLVESQSNAAQFFNNTYSVLVNAMMTALGESSLGISNTQPYQTDKTATEVKALQLQRNARDQYNQVFLAEAIKRQYMLWHTMNQVMLFSDVEGEEDAKPYIIRIVGKDALNYFIKSGLKDYNEADEYIAKYYELKKAQMESGMEIPKRYSMEEIGTPRFAINLGTKEKPEVKTKLRLEDDGQSGLLAIEPKDLKGDFDFVVDVESMAVSADDERKQARQAAVSMLATNPNVTQMLTQEGYKPKFKELFVTWLDDLGFSDSERYFEKLPTQTGGTGGIQDAIAALTGQGGRPPSPEALSGNKGNIPGGTDPNSGGGANQSSPFAQSQVQTEQQGGLNTETATPQYLQQNFRG